MHPLRCHLHEERDALKPCTQLVVNVETFQFQMFQMAFDTRQVMMPIASYAGQLASGEQ